MKTMKLVLGIVSMVLFIIVTFQSCAVGLGNTIVENGESSGTAGFILAICLLVAGIVGVAARKSKGGTITAACFYALGGIIGIANSGSYSDLVIWSVISFIFAVLFIISVIVAGNKTSNGENNAENV